MGLFTAGATEFMDIAQRAQAIIDSGRPPDTIRICLRGRVLDQPGEMRNALAAFANKMEDKARQNYQPGYGAKYGGVDANVWNMLTKIDKDGRLPASANAIVKDRNWQ